MCYSPDASDGMTVWWSKTRLNLKRPSARLLLDMPAPASLAAGASDAERFVQSWKHTWNKQDKEIALRRLQALYIEAPESRRAAAWRALLWPHGAQASTHGMTFPQMASAALRDPRASSVGKARLMDVLLGAVAEGYAAAVRLESVSAPAAAARHVVGGEPVQPPAPRRAAVNLRGHVAGHAAAAAHKQDVDTVLAAAQAMQQGGTSAGRASPTGHVAQALLRLLQADDDMAGGGDDDMAGGGDDDMAGGGDDDMAGGGDDDMAGGGGGGGGGFDDDVPGADDYYVDDVYAGSSFSDDYYGYNSGAYYLGADDVNAIFDDAAFGTSFLNSFFGSDYLAGPGASTSPYGSFDIYAGGDPLKQNFFSDTANLAPDWDANWNPASGEAPPIFDAADADVASATGTSASYSYVDYNSLQGGTANVGVTLLSDILAVSTAGGETKLMRDLGGVPVSGGRHEMRRGVSTFQTSPAGGLGAATTVTSQGYQPLIISDRAVLTSPQLRRRYNNAMPRASAHIALRTAPYWAFHPDANGRTPVTCVTQLVTEVNGTLASASRNSTVLFKKVDSKFNSTFGAVPTAVVSQFTGSAAVWRSAVVRLRAFSSTTAVTERGWEDIIGEMGGTLTLLMAAGNLLVTLALMTNRLCKNRNKNKEQAQSGEGDATSDPTQRQPESAAPSGSGQLQGSVNAVSPSGGEAPVAQIGAQS